MSPRRARHALCIAATALALSGCGTRGDGPPPETPLGRACAAEAQAHEAVVDAIDDGYDPVSEELRADNAVETTDAVLAGVLAQAKLQPFERRERTIDQVEADLALCHRKPR